MKHLPGEASKFYHPAWSCYPSHHLLVGVMAYKIAVTRINDKAEHIGTHARTVTCVAQVTDPADVNDGMRLHAQIFKRKITL